MGGNFKLNCSTLAEAMGVVSRGQTLKWYDSELTMEGKLFSAATLVDQIPPGTRMEDILNSCSTAVAHELLSISRIVQCTCTN